MYKKYLRYITMATLCFICLFGYLTYDGEETIPETKVESNVQTVIFKDSSDTLIPVSVDIGNEDSQENNYRGIIETMKSTDYTSLGLYPLLNDECIYF